jgi:branched-subunit amino acid aminotransferase/4-amino-4-deoxychorismate lyase
VSKDPAVPAHVKSSNYLAGVLALRDARAQGASEALLRAPDGTWVEATTSNLFVVHDGTILTPGEAHVLPGVTRALAIAAARDAGLAVVEGPVDDVALRTADEVFITSSVKEVVPVVRLGPDPVGDGRPGPVTQRVIALFSAGVARIQAAGAERLAEVFGA